MIGLETISTSSSMTMGFVTVPACSSLIGFDDSNPAFRHVACRAKQARGAKDEAVETVDTEETEDERDDRE